MKNTKELDIGKSFVINEEGTKSKLYVNFSSQAALRATRAQRMAEQYGKKLEESTGVKLEKTNHEDYESPEKIEKRKRALEKLSTFKDVS